MANTHEPVVFSAVLPDGSELALTESMLNAIDAVKEPGGYFHLLIDNKRIRLQLLHADFARHEFHFRWHAREFTIQLRDSVETIVHKLGLELEDEARINDIIAPMPGLVLQINVEKGMQVSKGDPLIILEAMKMENVLSAPNDGTIDEVLVKKGDAVDKAQLLIKIY